MFYFDSVFSEKSQFSLQFFYLSIFDRNLRCTISSLFEAFKLHYILLYFKLLYMLVYFLIVYLKIVSYSRKQTLSWRFWTEECLYFTLANAFNGEINESGFIYFAVSFILLFSLFIDSSSSEKSTPRIILPFPVVLSYRKNELLFQM